ncbi:hypothetical protein BPAE_0056g00390 [Botrytis paeoniae]|uniref:Uncharacterized protein n=1 Tax=Botrytis paeoniae TaxID=278948 RepID=A0A4Z1FSL1_9HELO|nr:hypothetical protein BPAE_0056g00390 [Botrytis paeoniae]
MLLEEEVSLSSAAPRALQTQEMVAELQSSLLLVVSIILQMALGAIHHLCLGNRITPVERIPEVYRSGPIAPLHVVLTQNQALPSSIQLSVSPKPRPEPMSLRSPSQSLGSPSPASFESNERTDSDQGSGSSPMSSLHSAEVLFPMILISVRLKEDLVPELSADLFVEWLRMMPVIAESVTVETGFSSFQH